MLDKELIDRSHNLKIIATPTTGLDHIDIDYAATKGIQIISLKGDIEFLAGIPATAEQTWGLILSLTRRIPWAYDSVKQNKWDRDSFIGNDLCGKNLGILGLGRIGSQVANYGKAFQMNVFAFDINDAVTPAKWVNKTNTMNELLTISDILTVHVPLNDYTYHLLGENELKSLKKGAFLVNSSRGAVIDSDALLYLLKNDLVAGAALDVLENELDDNSIKENDLVGYARNTGNLIITPHIGGATRESMHMTEYYIAEKVRNVVGQINIGLRNNCVE